MYPDTQLSDGANPETALADPNTNEEVQRIKGEVERMVVMAADFTVTGQTQVEEATNSLVLMKNAQKRLTELRKGYVDPPGEYVKMVNAAFKEITAPLDTAIRFIGDAIMTFNATVRALQEEEAELTRRQEALLQQTGLIMTPPPVVPAEARAAHTPMGSMNTRENWTWMVENFAALDDKYKLPDVGTITRLVKAGLREQAGLRIYDKGSVSVTARKEPSDG